MTTAGRDPWVDVKTRHGFQADEVISALQKEIRRGKADNAALLAYEMATTSSEMEAFLWRRLLVISVEDIGFGDTLAPVVTYNLHQICEVFGRGAGERVLVTIHAVRYLCTRLKDRSSDEMVMWIKRGVEGGTLLPTIPDYAIDMHTQRGRDGGRDIRHFLNEASRLDPELPDRDTTYRQRVLGMLDAQDG
jgi:replication-associated recombination protein RarA